MRPTGPPPAVRRDGRADRADAEDGSTAAATSPEESAQGRSATQGWDRRAPSEDEIEVDPEELREFLAADLLEVEADPVFRERLRHRLWKLVRLHRSRRPSGEDD